MRRLFIPEEFAPVVHVPEEIHLGCEAVGSSFERAEAGLQRDWRTLEEDPFLTPGRAAHIEEIQDEFCARYHDHRGSALEYRRN